MIQLVFLRRVINYSNMTFLENSEVIKALRILITYILMSLLVPGNALTRWFPDIFAGQLNTAKDLGGPIH
jgi:hypothetical protein